MVEDGIIELDSDFGKEIGFTSDKFEDISYLSKVRDYIYISCIQSKDPNRGYLSNLFKQIQDKGLGIKVPSPLPMMEVICMKKGFHRTIEYNDKAETPVDVWVLRR